MINPMKNPTFLSRVLFSDEANFCNNGQVNRHNMDYWAMENLYWMQTVHLQCSWSLNVWSGILGNHIIGLHLFEESLNGEVYTNFLENILPQLLKNVILDLCINMWIQHNGTAHSARISRLKMLEIFLQK